MKRRHLLWILPIFAFAAAAGCSQKPQSADAGEAIQKAKTFQTTEEKVQYLAREARAFLSSERFDDAVKTAQYILSKVDGSSQEARSILDEAKAKLAAMAQKKAEELKGKVKNTLGSLGQ